MIFGGFVDKKCGCGLDLAPAGSQTMHNITSSPYHFHFFSFS